MYIQYVYYRAVPQLRRFVALPGSVQVGFEVDKAALGQVALRDLWFPPVNTIPPWFFILVYHLGDEQ